VPIISNCELTVAWWHLLNDFTTTTAFVELTLPRLISSLASALPHAHSHDIATAAGETLFAFVKQPRTYDPTKSQLLSFLTFNAKRDYLNLRAREAKHHRKRIPWDSVELVTPIGNEEDDDSLTFDHPALQAEIATLSDSERAVLELLRLGRRDTAEFAAVLGIADRPNTEQETEVKRVKDRIKVRLKRAVGGTNG
jgi:DNA-directed RNA polymerase specialized sigma24 family protein